MENKEMKKMVEELVALGEKNCEFLKTAAVGTEFGMVFPELYKDCIAEGDEVAALRLIIKKAYPELKVDVLETNLKYEMNKNNTIRYGNTIFYGPERIPQILEGLMRGVAIGMINKPGQNFNFSFFTIVPLNK